MHTTNSSVSVTVLHGQLCIIDRVMNRFYYRDILKQRLLPSIKKFKFGKEFVFMHDNVPKHRSGLIKD